MRKSLSAIAFVALTCSAQADAPVTAHNKCKFYARLMVAPQDGAKALGWFIIPPGKELPLTNRDGTPFRHAGRVLYQYGEAYRPKPRNAEPNPNIDTVLDEGTPRVFELVGPLQPAREQIIPFYGNPDYLPKALFQGKSVEVSATRPAMVNGTLRLVLECPSRG